MATAEKPGVDSRWNSPKTDVLPDVGSYVWFLVKDRVRSGRYFSGCFMEGIDSAYPNSEVDGWLPAQSPKCSGSCKCSDKKASTGASELQIKRRYGSGLAMPEKKTPGACAVDFYLDLLGGYERIHNQPGPFTLTDDPVVEMCSVDTDGASVPPGATVRVGLGCNVQFAPGSLLLLAFRSKAALYGLTLTNSVGLIDSDYRGTLMAVIRNDSSNTWIMQHSDRIIQGALLNQGEWTVSEVNELSQTIRGDGGFGHTGS